MMKNDFVQRFFLHDRRLLHGSLVLGVIYALCTVIGREMQKYSQFQTSFWLLAGQFVLLAAVFALVVIVILATIRGDHLYMGVTSMLMCAVALVKLAAWHIYNRTM